MNTTPIPYTCVVGVTSRAQATAIADGVPHKDGARPVLLAVMATPQTLRDEPRATDPQLYPLGSNLASTFIADEVKYPHVLNAVLMTGWKGSELGVAMRQAELCGKGLLDAIVVETDDRWPEPACLREWASVDRGTSRKPVLLLSVSARLLLSHGREIANRCATYPEVSQIILVGGGEKMGALSPIWKTAREIAAHPQLREVAIGIAGKLGPETLDGLLPVAHRRGQVLTVKAKSGLHDGSPRALCTQRAISFIAAAEAAFEKLRGRQRRWAQVRDERRRKRLKESKSDPETVPAAA
jgi:hypothetical protein